MAEEATSPDAVELTHRAYASVNTRDLDAITALMGPASVWDASRWDLGTHTGADAIRRFADDWVGSLYEYGVRVKEMHDLGNGVVWAVQTAHRATSRHGYIEVQSALVFVWVDGLLARATIYTEPDEARAAAERLAQERG